MKPIDVFNVAIIRSRKCIFLYDAMHNSKPKPVKKEWIESFNESMGWDKEESSIRIDGQKQNTVFIMKHDIGISRTELSNSYLSELLRSAIVSSIAALDRYMHDIIVQHCIAMLSRPEASIPKELKKLQIPVLVTKNVLEKKSKSDKSRPGYMLKLAIQNQLHREYTFQQPDDILKATKMIGVEDFWSKVSAKLNEKPKPKDIIAKMNKIAVRRNQIVHEADIERKIKAKEITFRAISKNEVVEIVDWIEIFVRATDSVIGESV